MYVYSFFLLIRSGGQAVGRPEQASQQAGHAAVRAGAALPQLAVRPCALGEDAADVGQGRGLGGEHGGTQRAQAGLQGRLFAHKGRQRAGDTGLQRGEVSSRERGKDSIVANCCLWANCASPFKYSLFLFLFFSLPFTRIHHSHPRVRGNARKRTAGAAAHRRTRAWARRHRHVSRAWCATGLMRCGQRAHEQRTDRLAVVLLLLLLLLPLLLLMLILYQYAALY